MLKEEKEQHKTWLISQQKNAYNNRYYCVIAWAVIEWKFTNNKYDLRDHFTHHVTCQKLPPETVIGVFPRKNHWPTPVD